MQEPAAALCGHVVLKSLQGLAVLDVVTVVVITVVVITDCVIGTHCLHDI